MKAANGSASAWLDYSRSSLRCPHATDMIRADTTSPASQTQSTPWASNTARENPRASWSRSAITSPDGRPTACHRTLLRSGADPTASTNTRAPAPRLMRVPSISRACPSTLNRCCCAIGSESAACSYIRPTWSLVPVTGTANKAFDRFEVALITPRPLLKTANQARATEFTTGDLEPARYVFMRHASLLHR
jgi:hypothetical protein